MLTAVRMADGGSVTGIGFDGFDTAFDVTDTNGVRISNVAVAGRVAVKGTRAKDLTLTNIAHSYRPIPNLLAFAIRRAIYGYV